MFSILLPKLHDFSFFIVIPFLGLSYKLKYRQKFFFDLFENNK